MCRNDVFLPFFKKKRPDKCQCDCFPRILCISTIRSLLRTSNFLPLLILFGELKPNIEASLGKSHNTSTRNQIGKQWKAENLCKARKWWIPISACFGGILMS